MTDFSITAILVATVLVTWICAGFLVNLHFLVGRELWTRDRQIEALETTVQSLTERLCDFEQSTNDWIMGSAQYLPDDMDCIATERDFSFRDPFEDGDEDEYEPTFKEWECSSARS